jgi:hypothetical protein
MGAAESILEPRPGRRQLLIGASPGSAPREQAGFLTRCFPVHGELLIWRSGPGDPVAGGNDAQGSPVMRELIAEYSSSFFALFSRYYRTTPYSIVSIVNVKSEYGK